MKKFFTTLVIIFWVFRLSASITVYAPALTSPADTAVDQMPNVFLDWAPVSGGFGLQYDIQIDNNNVFSNPVILTTSLTAINASELKFGEKYYWRVRAYDNTDTSSWSVIRSFRVISKVKMIPLTANSLNCYLLNGYIEWHPVTGITHYDYEIDTISSFNSTFLISNTLPSTPAKLFFPQGLYSNLIYFIRVRARHDLDVSLWSVTDTFRICNSTPNFPELSKPENMAVNQPTTLFLDWLPLTDATSYVIQYGTDINFANAVTIPFTPATNNIYTVSNSRDSISGLVNNKTYYWHVKAIKGNEISLWSQTWSFTTIDSIPAIPTLILPSDLAINIYPTIQLQWSSVTNASSYRIEYGYNPSTSVTVSSNTNNLSIHNLKFDSIYHWHVKAINGTDTSNWSTVRSFTVINYPSLLSPTNNSIGENLNATLKWENVSGVTKYNVQIDTTLAFNSLLQVDSILTGTSINLFAALYNTKYFWRVKAMHAADTSTWSPAWSFTTKDTMPATPILLLPVNASLNLSSVIHLTWTPVVGASSYKVEYDTVITFATADTITTTTNSTNTASLLFGYTYYWRVRAFGTHDTSSCSTIFHFSVIDAPYLVIPVDSAVNQKPIVLLKWLPISGALKYFIEYDTDVMFATSNTVIAITDSVNIDTLLYGTTYYWRVKAISINDTSNWSVVKSFTVIDIPQLVSPINSAVNQMPDIFLKWMRIEGSTKYIIEYDTALLFSNPLILTAVDTTIIPNNFLFGKTYYWRVKAISGTDTSNWSSVYSFTVVNTLNQISPNNNAITTVAVVLKWESISSVTHYECQLDTTINFNSSLLKSLVIDCDVPVVQAFSTQSLLGMDYFWRVRAINSGDTSAWSTVRKFTTLNNLTLAMPYNGAINQMPDVSLRSFNLTGISNYLFELDTTPMFDSFLYTLSYPGSNVPFVETATTELLFGTKYFWRAKAKLGSSFSNWSNTWAFTTIDKVILSAPADSSTSQSANITLKWKAIEGVTDYIVEIDTSTTFSHAVSDTVVASSNQLVLAANTLLVNKRYYWRVKAMHAKDESGWSDRWSFKSAYNVGINDNAAVNSISMYPNPAKGMVNIEINISLASTIDMQVLDITGRIVYAERVSVIKGQNIKHINLSNLTQGIYILSLKNDNFNFNKKLILNN